MTYPIFQIDDYEKIEQMGSKEKFWYFDQKEKVNKLFKIGRPGTGENWAEKVTCEIAHLLKIPCAEYDFAIWKDKEGVTSPIFVPDHARLIHGNELLGKAVDNYPQKATYHSRDYKISTVVAIMHLLKDVINLPIGYGENKYIKKPIDVFIGYLMFDCLISNQDRHHENWGIIADYKNNKNYLAPTYDHASSLGCRVSDGEIIDRMSTKDSRYNVKSFVNKCKSAFSSKDGKRISPLVAFLVAAKQNLDASSYWINQVENLSLRTMTNIFNEIPEPLININSVRFVVEILHANRSNILECKEILKL